MMLEVINKLLLVGVGGEAIEFYTSTRGLPSEIEKSVEVMSLYPICVTESNAVLHKFRVISFVDDKSIHAGRYIRGEEVRFFSLFRRLLLAYYWLLRWVFALVINYLRFWLTVGLSTSWRRTGLRFFMQPNWWSSSSWCVSCCRLRSGWFFLEGF